MRKSQSITITVLAGLMLTACCVSMSGWGRHREPDHTWYDANGNRIAEKWKTDAGGHKLLDAQGRPIPDPHVPYDRYHRPWVFVNGVWAPLQPPDDSSGSSSSTSHSYYPRPWFFWGGSGYRSFGSGSSRSSSSPSSISRGGFGSTGHGGG
jgi:uncharacterized membrane protein YgcG